MALEHIRRRKEIETQIFHIGCQLSGINLQPKLVDKSDAMSKIEGLTARHGQNPKSERAKGDLAALQEMLRHATGIYEKAKAEDEVLRKELKALQEELENLSIAFSMGELKSAKERIAALEKEEKNIADALKEKEEIAARVDEGDAMYAELQKEREDLLAQQATGADVKAPMDKLLKKMGDFQATDVKRTEAALAAAPVAAGLRRKLEAVQKELTQAKEDAKELTQLFILSEIDKENQVYSSLKGQIAASFTRITSLSELIPPNRASAIMPASGAYRLYIPAFRLLQGDAKFDEDFSARAIDRPSAVAAERDKLIKQGARL